LSTECEGEPRMKRLAEVLLFLAGPVNAIPPYGEDIGPLHLAVELLEDRRPLSTSILLDPLSWTFIGPAPNVDHDPSTGYVENASGGITGIAADPTDPNTLYIAAAGGGVWKSIPAKGGLTWIPLTDQQPVVPAAKRTQFMGAIALAQSDPNVIYAGTGEAN